MLMQFHTIILNKKILFFSNKSSKTVPMHITYNKKNSESSIHWKLGKNSSILFLAGEVF